jgi:hypothetical protein
MAGRVECSASKAHHPATDGLFPIEILAEHQRRALPHALHTNSGSRSELKG